MIDVMIKKNGQRADIEPYKWVFIEDGLPAFPENPDNPKALLRPTGWRPHREGLLQRSYSGKMVIRVKYPYCNK